MDPSVEIRTQRRDVIGEERKVTIIAGGIGTGDRNARDSEGNGGTEADAIEYSSRRFLVSWRMRLFWGWVASDEFSMRI
jgi:hypothetical protein